MANGDYGYFGKGDTGYAQYMTAFNRNFGGSSGGGGGGGNHNNGGGGGGDGVVIENITFDDNNHMIISYSNGTTQDAGEATISRVSTTSLYVPEGDSFILDAGDAMSK